MKNKRIIKRTNLLTIIILGLILSIGFNTTLYAAHSHSDGCYTVVKHSHTESCYDITYHAHTPESGSCYTPVYHAHTGQSGSCYSPVYHSHVSACHRITYHSSHSGGCYNTPQCNGASWADYRVCSCGAEGGGSGGGCPAGKSGCSIVHRYTGFVCRGSSVSGNPHTHSSDTVLTCSRPIGSVESDTIVCGKNGSTIESYSLRCGKNDTSIESYNLSCVKNDTTIETKTLKCGKDNNTIESKTLTCGQTESSDPVPTPTPTPTPDPTPSPTPTPSPSPDAKPSAPQETTPDTSKEKPKEEVKKEDKSEKGKTDTKTEEVKVIEEESLMTEISTIKTVSANNNKMENNTEPDEPTDEDIPLNIEEQQVPLSASVVGVITAPIGILAIISAALFFLFGSNVSILEFVSEDNDYTFIMKKNLRKTKYGLFIKFKDTDIDKIQSRLLKIEMSEKLFEKTMGEILYIDLPSGNTLEIEVNSNQLSFEIPEKEKEDYE